MATLHINGEIREIPEGTPFYKIAEEMGIIFGCREGICEVCRVKVVKGEEHLNEITQNEKDMGVSRPHRLCCQMIATSGDIHIIQDNGL